MMPRERISFEKPIETRGKSGSLYMEYSPCLVDVPAERRKQNPSYGEGINARELFTGITIVFWVRFHPEIKDNMRIIYNGNRYKIIDLNRQYHNNSYLITCRKEDK